jgi:hypothetical protein
MKTNEFITTPIENDDDDFDLVINAPVSDEEKERVRIIDDVDIDELFNLSSSLYNDEYLDDETADGAQLSDELLSEGKLPISETEEEIENVITYLRGVARIRSRGSIPVDGELVSRQKRTKLTAQQADFYNYVLDEMYDSNDSVIKLIDSYLERQYGGNDSAPVKRARTQLYAIVDLLTVTRAELRYQERARDKILQANYDEVDTAMSNRMDVLSKMKSDKAITISQIKVSSGSKEYSCECGNWSEMKKEFYHINVIPDSSQVDKRMAVGPDYNTCDKCGCHAFLSEEAILRIRNHVMENKMYFDPRIVGGLRMGGTTLAYNSLKKVLSGLVTIEIIEDPESGENVKSLYEMPDMEANMNFYLESFRDRRLYFDILKKGDRLSILQYMANNGGGIFMRSFERYFPTLCSSIAQRKDFKKILELKKKRDRIESALYDISSARKICGLLLSGNKEESEVVGYWGEVNIREGLAKFCSEYKINWKFNLENGNASWIYRIDRENIEELLKEIVLAEDEISLENKEILDEFYTLKSSYFINPDRFKFTIEEEPKYGAFLFEVFDESIIPRLREVYAKILEVRAIEFMHRISSESPTLAGICSRWERGVGVNIKDLCKDVEAVSGHFVLNIDTHFKKFYEWILTLTNLENDLKRFSEGGEISPALISLFGVDVNLNLEDFLKYCKYQLNGYPRRSLLYAIFIRYMLHEEPEIDLAVGFMMVSRSQMSFSNSKIHDTLKMFERSEYTLKDLYTDTIHYDGSEDVPEVWQAVDLSEEQRVAIESFRAQTSEDFITKYEAEWRRVLVGDDTPKSVDG